MKTQNKETKEMNIDFIKWMCEQTEEFTFGDFNDISVKDSGYGASMRTKQYKKVIYPLLLQRTIEGVEEITSTLVFTKHAGGWMWNSLHNWRIDWDGVKTIDNSFYETADQAKESALKYIYEQETE